MVGDACVPTEMTLKICKLVSPSVFDEGGVGCLRTVPMTVPNLSGPTVSRHSASPMVQTT